MTRYTDTNSAASAPSDFVIRKRIPSIPQLVIIFLGALIVELGVMLTLAENDKVAVLAILLIVLGSVGWYVIVQLQRNRDLVMTTEFQNALFASALGINNKFCLIIRQDGNIVYMDRAFQNLFPDFLKQPRRTIDVLLDSGRISQEESRKIFTAIERSVYDKVVFSIRDSRGNFHKIVMSIEPILRPAGFILLRGREYIEQRSVIEMADLSAGVSPINQSTIALFSYVMDTMDMGVYMTDPLGNIIYANPVLEQWLGFRQGEIASSNLSLQDVIHHNGKRVNAIQPGNYEGVLTLQKKTGALMEGFINQKIIRNDQGKPIGCTALVHNIIGQSADEKKKLW